MSTLVDIDVYLQAVGGKYLGPHAHDMDDIRITLTYPNHEREICYNPSKSKDDGTVDTTFTDGLSSPFPILSQQSSGGPLVNYLTPGKNPIKGSITNVLLGDEYNQ